MEKCVICGKEIDLTACNNAYAVIEYVTDSDEKGTQKLRRYLCGRCGLKIRHLTEDK